MSLLKKIVEEGIDQPDRTGVGRKTLFGEKLEFNLDEGFPLVTTRYINFRIAAEELFWFITGNNSIKPLKHKKINIWNNWAVDLNHINDYIDKLNKTGIISDLIGKDNNIHDFIINEIKNNYEDSIGPIYGHNWRKLYTPLNIIERNYIIYCIENNIIEKEKTY